MLDTLVPVPEFGDDHTMSPPDPAGTPDESARFGGVRFAWFLLAVLVAVGVWQFVTNGFDDVDPDTGDPVVEVDGADD